MQIILQYLYICTYILQKGRFTCGGRRGALFLGPHHGNSICQQCHRSKNIGRSHTFLKPILSNDSTQNSNNISDFFLHNNDSCPKLMFFLPYFFNYFTCPPYKTNEINFGFGPACNDHYFRKGSLFY